MEVFIMRIKNMPHYAVDTWEIDKTLEFYDKLLGFKEGL